MKWRNRRALAFGMAFMMVVSSLALPNQGETVYADETETVSVDIPINLILENDSDVRDTQYVFKLEAVTEGAPMPSSDLLTLDSPTGAGPVAMVSSSWTVSVPNDGIYQYKITETSTAVANETVDTGAWLVSIDGGLPGISYTLYFASASDLSDETKGGSRSGYETYSDLFINSYTCPHDSWTISADGDILRANCNACANCRYHGTGLDMRLEAPSSTTYTGSALEAAFNATQKTTWKSFDLDVPVIKYYNASDELLDTKPIDVGTYTAKANLNGNKVSVTYTISKASGAIKTKPTLKKNLTYTGSAQTLITAGASTAGTLQYRIGTNGTWSTDLPQATDAGSYAIYYRLVGDSNHNDVNATSLGTVTIAKASQTVTAPSGLRYTASVVELNSLTSPANGYGTVTYAVNTKNTAPSSGWSSTPKFTDLNAETTYYFFAKFSGDANHLAGTSSGTAIKTGSKAKQITTGVTANTDNAFDYVPEADPSGNPGYEPTDLFTGTPQIVSGTPIDADANNKTSTVSYSYRGRGTTVYALSADKPHTAGLYELVITVTDAENIATQTIPFEILKLDQTAPDSDSLSAYSEIARDASDGQIEGLSTSVLYQYSLDEGDSWIDVAEGSDEVTGLPAGKVWLRKKELTNYNASPATELTIQEGVVITDGTNTWKSFVNTISFGILAKKTQYVTLSGMDQANGIACYEYYLSSEAMTADQVEGLSEGSWTLYPNLGLRLNPSQKYFAYFKLTDVDGVKHYISTDGLEVDSSAPLILGLESSKTYFVSEGGRNFRVEDLDLKSVIAEYEADGESQSLILTATSVDAEISTFELPAHSYSQIRALDRCGNQTILTDVSVELGQSAPSLGEAQAEEDGYYVYDASDSENPAFIYQYEEKPGNAVILAINENYEIYSGTLNAKGQASCLLEEGDILAAGSTLYVRRKAIEDPLTGPSDFTTYVLAKKDTVSVTVYSAKQKAGSVAISGSRTNSALFYVGEEITITAKAGEGYRFSRWIDRETGATVSEESQYSFSLTSKDACVCYQAVFDVEGDKVVTIPTAKNTDRTAFTYTGKTIAVLAEEDIPDHTTLTEDSVLSAENAGTYTYTLALEEGYIWGDGSSQPISFNWHIYQAAGESLSASYNKTSQKITVKDIPEGRGIEYKFEADGQTETVAASEIEANKYSFAISQPGTYYIRSRKDQNHTAGPWVSLVAEYQNPVISVLSPGNFVREENPCVTLNASLSTTDHVKAITLCYREKGAEEWKTVDQSVSTQITYTLGASREDRLDFNTEYQYYLSLEMEGSYQITGSIASFNTGRRDGSQTKAKGSLTVTVTNDSSINRQAAVTLKERESALTSETVTMVAFGSSTICLTGLEDGAYSLEITSSDGNFSETESVCIENGCALSRSVTLEPGKVSTHIKLDEDTPNITVNGLSDLITAAELSKAGRTENPVGIDVLLQVEAEDEAAAVGAEDLQEILPTSGREIEAYFDLELFKTATQYDSTGQATASTVTDIGLTNRKVIEIVIPRNSAYKNVSVMRYHDGQASNLTGLAARPSDYFTDGTYYADQNYIYLYASGFSTYALVADSAEKTSFSTYQTTMETKADGLLKTGDSTAVKKLIKAAKKTMAAFTYDEDLTLEENKALVDEVYATLKAEVKAQRTKDRNHAEFARYKQTTKAKMKELKRDNDTEASEKLIEAALEKANALSYDDGKSLSANKEALDTIYNQLKQALKEQRAKDGTTSRGVKPPKTDDPGNTSSANGWTDFKPEEELKLFESEKDKDGEDESL